MPGTDTHGFINQYNSQRMESEGVMVNGVRWLLSTELMIASETVCTVLEKHCFIQGEFK